MEDKRKGEYIEQIKLLKERIAELEISDSERRQQQEMRRLATVVRDSNDAITIQDFEGRITAWNRGAELIYGYKEKEALGMNIDRLTFPGKAAEQKEFTRRLIAGETITSFETRRITKDGRILDIWMTVTKVADDTGKPVGIASTERDITVRKKAEEALRVSEGKFKAIFDTANDGMLLADVETKKFYTGNKAICRMLGYGLEEINNLGVADIHPRESLPYVMEQLERQVRKEVAVAKDLPVKRKDGSVFYADVNTSSITLAGKTYLLGLFRDITERKKAEEQISHAKKEWEDTFDSITDIVTIHDLDCNILRANRAAESAFGLKLKEFLDCKCHKIYHKKDRPPEGCPGRDVLKTGKVCAAEFYESSLGMYVEIKAFPRFDENRNIIGMVHILRDIDQRKGNEEEIVKTKNELEEQARALDKQLKEAIRSRETMASMLDDNNQIRGELEKKLQELKQAQAMLVQSEKLASLGKLVADMAHEVNNPLMIISGNAQLSLLDEPLTDRLKNNLKIIHEECNRAKTIIQRLLMFSRPSKDEQKPLDINQGIGSVVKLLEHQFSLSNVKINLQLAAGLPLIPADEKQFQEVIMNLVNNARDAMLGGGGGGGEIVIKTSLDGAYVKVEIKDSGVGMDDTALTRIFEPFFTTKETGTGLGLSVCYGIIKAHKGRIEFTSQPQKGTTAHIWLPVTGGGA